jgi:O-methyltransferase
MLARNKEAHMRRLHVPLMTIKSTVLMGVRRFGYELHKTAKVSAGLTHDDVHPLASYAPWNGDASFMDVHRRIQRNTFLDIYRLYELWTLVGQSSKLSGKGSLLEVGVWRGGSGALIAHRARQCGVSDPIYLCDTFTGVAKAGAEDPYYRGGEHDDTSTNIVERLIAGFELRDVYVLSGVFPEESGSRIGAAEKFRFCHIDVDVYQSTRDVLEWVWPRLLPGGIVVIDDFGFRGCEGVTRYIEEIGREPDRIFIHNLNGHGILIKLA